MSYGSKRYWVGRALRVGAMLLLAHGQAAQAADDTPLLAEARRLLEDGQAARSAALLAQQLGNMAGQADYDYLLGLALYRSGQTGQAMFAFERVLMAEPGHVDARLKAAQISAGRGSAASVNELLAPLATQELTGSQRQLLDEIRETLAATSRPLGVRAYVQTGLGYDDNATGGPDQTALMLPQAGMGGRPPPPPQLTQLGSASRDRDTVGALEGGIALARQVGEETWLNADATLYRGMNRVRKDVAADYGNLSAGVATRSGSDTFAAALIGQNYRIGGKTYRNTQGWRANWMHGFDDASTLSVYLQQLGFKYPDYSIDDSTRSLIGLAREAAVTDGIVLQYGLYGGKDIARDASKPHFSFTVAGVNLGAEMKVAPDLQLSLGASYEARPHDAIDALYHFTRRDTVRSIGVSADYRLSRDWHLVPRYTRLRNASNIELYDYTRNIFMLQLRWEYDNAND